MSDGRTILQAIEAGSDRLVVGSACEEAWQFKISRQKTRRGHYWDVRGAQSSLEAKARRRVEARMPNARSLEAPGEAGFCLKLASGMKTTRSMLSYDRLEARTQKH